jgi:hypothetical protein
VDGRTVAWISYVPLPGLALLAVRLHPHDRLTRFHAWQGTILVVGLLATMLVVGLLTMLSDAEGYRAAVGGLAGAALVAGVVQLVWGGVAAALGRFTRLRPAWDVAAALRGDR